MAHLELQKFSTEWVATNFKNSYANVALFPVSAGEYVVGAAYRIVTAFGANCVINFGDGAGEASYDSIGKNVTNTVAFTQADGAYLINSMGKLYTSADTIDMDYTAGDAAANGKVRFYIVKGRLEP